jgi:nucleoside 2-deoxyribosyltransferase
LFSLSSLKVKMIRKTVKVYLAGPINGCTDGEANDWRDTAKKFLGAENCLDPMRRDYRGKEDEHVVEIVQDDLRDIDVCDVFFANCWQVSWGTAMEIFYAADQGKEVICVFPEGARISPWIRYHASEVCFSFEDALELARG